jgi:hypothetical protein
MTPAPPQPSPASRASSAQVSSFVIRHSPFLPVRVSCSEALLLRFCFAVAVVWGLWPVLKHEKMNAPTGLAYLMDVSIFGGDDAVIWFRPLIVIAAVLYVLDVIRPLGLVLLTAAHLGYNTLHNSQGFTYHGNNIIGLILLAQCGAELYWFGYRLVKGRAFTFAAGLTRHAYHLYFAQCAIAAVYVTSALTKLSKSDGLWLFRSHYLAKSIVKTHRQTFYDNPDGAFAQPTVTIAQWLADHHILTRLAFGIGFFLELFAFLALWNRAWALCIGLGIIAFHFGVEMIMQLDFRVNQLMCLIFLVNIPFWMMWLVRGRKRSALGSA